MSSVSFCEVKLHGNATEVMSITTDTTDALSRAHVFASSVSALSCIVVLVVSTKFRQLSAFPNNMLLWKTACDLLTALCVVGMNGALIGGEPGPAICQDGVLAGVIGFSMLASPGWFFALAYNLNRSLHDPFTRPRSRMMKLHVWVWGSSLAGGIGVGVLGEFRPKLHVCYVCQGAPAAVIWLLYLAWVLVYWALAAVILVDAWFWLIYTKRVTNRLSSRATQLHASAMHVAIMGSTWVLLGVSFAIAVGADSDRPEPREDDLGQSLFFAVAVGFLGISDLVSWAASSLAPALFDMYRHRKLENLIRQDRDEVPAENPPALCWTARARRAPRLRRVRRRPRRRPRRHRLARRRFPPGTASKASGSES